MKDWLNDNPNGLKDAFEQYFKALPVDIRKVSNNSHFPFPLALVIMFCVDIQGSCNYSCMGFRDSCLVITMC